MSLQIPSIIITNPIGDQVISDAELEAGIPVEDPDDFCIQDLDINKDYTVLFDDMTDIVDVDDRGRSVSKVYRIARKCVFSFRPTLQTIPEYPQPSFKQEYHDY